MNYLESDGRLYEFTVISEAHTDDWVVECVDLGADGPGLIGDIRVGPTHVGKLSLRNPVTAPVLMRWLEVAADETGFSALAPGLQ